MSSKNINNIVWACVPIKNNSLEGFSNAKTNTIECGLPYIKAYPNKNDSEIAIFNKMALEARSIQKMSMVESFKNNK
jgi:hypothetical protein